MTIAHHATGAKGGGFPSLGFLSIPSPVHKEVLALAGRTIWHSNITAQDAYGWLPTTDVAGGTGTAADAHTTRIRVDRRQLTGREDPAASQWFGQNAPEPFTTEGIFGVIAAYSKAPSYQWLVASVGGDDNTHAANRTVPAGSAISLAPGDVVVAFVAIDTDVALASFASPVISAPGITFGATTRRTSGAGTSQGNNGNIEVFDATVTAGTASATLSLNFTTTTAQCGPVAFVRLREGPPWVSGWRPTTTQLLDLGPSVPRRFDTFRFDLVTNRNQKIGEVHPDLDRNPTITSDTSRAVHRSLDSFYLPASERQAINQFSDRVRPYMVLQNGVEFSLGVFLWADQQLPQRPWGPEREGKLLDKTYQLDQPRPFAMSIPRHYPVLQWVLDLINEFPEFSNRSEIDPGYGEDWNAQVVRWNVSYFDEQAASKVLGGPVTWAAGTNTLKLLNDVMRLVIYLPVHANRDGTLVLKHTSPIGQIPATLMYDVGRNMVENSIVRSDDLLSAPNMVFVYENSINGGVQWGVWHAPASAPYSEQNRGYRVSKVIAMSGLDSWEEAQAAAQAASEWVLKSGTWIEWDGPADPRHDCYDMLLVMNEKWIEVSWKLVCVTGQPMHHRALKIYPGNEEGP